MSDERNLLLLQPAPSNDAGFAMTSSFTSMMLTALLVFDPADLAQKEARVAELIASRSRILADVADVQALTELGTAGHLSWSRAVLWSGARSSAENFGVDREGRLRLCVASWFRHGQISG